MLKDSVWCPGEFIEPASLACPECTYESSNQVAVACVPAAAQLLERLRGDGWGWYKRRTYAIRLIQTTVVHDLTGETKVSYRVADLAHLNKDDVSLVMQVHSLECDTVEGAVQTAVAYVQSVLYVTPEKGPKRQFEETALRLFAEYGHYLVGSGNVTIKYKAKARGGKQRTATQLFSVRSMKMKQRYQAGDYRWRWPYEE